MMMLLKLATTLDEEKNLYYANLTHQEHLKGSFSYKKCFLAIDGATACK